MSFYRAIASLLFINLAATVSTAQAVEFNNAEYEIYVGDINGDGVDDIYLQEPEGLILLHGDIVTPIVIPPDGPSYAILSNGTTYAAPVEDNTVDTSTLTELTSGYSVYDQNNDGNDDLLVSQTGNLLHNVSIAANGGSAPTLISTVPPAPAPAPYDAIGNLDSLVAVGDTDTIGSVPGSFRVNESGAATYNIPIPTAAGTAGVVPQLSLNYSSQGGNGLIGLGWSIGGLSGITRCRQTLHQDDNPTPITWSADDRFCLDGQRLILETGTNYGDVGSTYKTEIDSFAKIIAKDGSAGHPDYFQVERKDGSVSFYGNTADSKQQNSATPTAQTLTWAINKFQDSVGNPIWFIYHNDANGHRIKEVRYAYGSSDGPSGHGATVEFLYEDRGDVGSRDDISGFVGGYQFKTAKRLQTVISENGSSELRRYNLLYKNKLADIDSDANITVPNALSRLASVEECVGTTTSACTPLTTFDWTDPAAGFAATGTSFEVATGGKNYLLAYKPADVNGDGLQDLVWLEAFVPTGNGGSHHQLRYVLAEDDGSGLKDVPEDFSNNNDYIRYQEDYGIPFKMDVIDYNADGRMDVIVYNDNVGFWKVYLSGPQTEGGNVVWRLNSTPIDTPINREKAQFADVNSDGLIDAFYRDNNDFKVRYLIKDSSQSASSNHYYVFGPEQDFGGYSPAPGQYAGIFDYNLAGDIDGDGDVDVQYSTVDVTQCPNPLEGPCTITHTSNYAVSENGTLQNVFTWNRLDDSHAVDLNGDGLSDSIYRSGPPDSGIVDGVYFRLNTGSTFNNRVLIPGVGSSQTTFDAMRFYDHNSDGHPDLLWHDLTNQQLKLHLWLPETNNFGSAEVIRSASDDLDEVHMFFDTNGDGVSDYVRYLDENFYFYLGNGSNQSKNVITKITNGLGAETDVTYETLSQTDHYGRVDISSSETCNTINIPWGSGTLDYCLTSANADDFYTALNGDWDLPNGSHTLGKHSPVLELHGPINVVTRVDSSAPKAGATAGSVDSSAKSAIEYHYREAKIQASGRGLLGFHTLRTVDMQSGVETTTAYRQDWPFIGYPLRTEVRSSAGHLLSESENTWNATNISNWTTAGTNAEANGTASLGAMRPYIEQSVEKTYELVSNGATAGSVLQTVTTDNVYDDYDDDGSPDAGQLYGNPTKITVTTEGGSKKFQKITKNEYTGSAITLTDHAAAQSYAELGRLTKTTVESKRDEDDNGSYELTDTRESSFTYYSSGHRAGLLKLEKIEPNGTQEEELTTTHDYDARGNRVKSYTTGWNGSATVNRCNHTTAVYDGDGRYIDTTYDCQGRKTSSVVSRNSFGEPTEVNSYIDTNGTSYVATGYQYSIRGIRYSEASETGAWSGTTLHNGTGGHCPSGTQYHSKTQAPGDKDGIGRSESRECFDVLGRSVRAIAKGFADDTWIYQDTEYDNLGRVVRKSEPYFSNAQNIYWTTLTYDILGRVTDTLLPDGSIGTVDYNGFVTETTNDLTQTKKETKNALGETIEVEDNEGGKVTYAYDAQGNMTHMHSWGNGASVLHSTVITYDQLGRKLTMDDPDKGDWAYDYNAFGELILQTDAKGQTSTLIYDSLGRLESRIDRRADTTIEGNTSWVYDASSNGLGQLHTVEDSVSGYLKELTYDSLGRPSKTLTSLGGSDGDHYEKVTYDPFSRTFQVFDAARNDDVYTDNGIQYRYNARGYRDQIHDASTINGAQTVYQEITSMDARGNITGEDRAGGVITSGMEYYEDTGRIKRIYADDSLANNVQDLHYQWDTLGNLQHRKEFSGSKNLQEDFTYDGLNRLETYTVAGQATKSMRYNSLGNIVYKSDVCTGSGDCYIYGESAAGPHAVTKVNTTNYTYDANGNNETGDGRDVDYTTFDKPYSIEKGNHTTTFDYAPDRSRYKRTDSTGSGTRTTLYIGSVEKITQTDGTKQTKRYIGGIAIITEHLDSNNNPTQLATLNYIFKDHLGSTDVITDDIGTIATAAGGEQSFDAWGQRRSAANWQDITEAVRIAGFGVLGNSDLITTRGFTGHEMVDEVGVIHMNGRIYDPKLGRFLQADPFVQAPTDTQMLNRYSYTRNNPLNATDPSGYIIPAIAAAIAYKLTGDLVIAAVAAGITAAVSTIAQGGNLRQALISGISAAALTYVGGDFALSGESIFSSAGGIFVAKIATIGGITASLQGGHFGNGFVVAGVSAFVGGAVGGSDWFSGLDYAPQVAVKAIVGGTLSEASGGKFANGAATAAFAAVANMTIKRISDALVKNIPRINPQEKIDAQMTELTTDEPLDDIFSNERSVKIAYSHRGVGAPPEVQEIIVVAQSNYTPIDLSFDVSGYYTAILRNIAEREAVRAYAQNVAQFKSWQNFANKANAAGSAPAALVCLNPAGAAVCKSMFWGAAGSAAFDGFAQREITPSSLLKGAAIGGALSPATSSYIKAAGGSFGANSVGKFNEYWIGVSIGEATPTP